MGERMLDAATRRDARLLSLSAMFPCGNGIGDEGTTMEGRRKGRGDLIQLNTIIVIARLLVLQRN